MTQRKLRILLSWPVLLILCCVPCAADPAPRAGMLFEGHVYRGPSTAAGLPNVTIQLWCYAPPIIPTWQCRLTGTTNASGAFRLRDYADGIPTSVQYRLVKVNPPGYRSHSAQPGVCAWPCISNRTVGADMVEYTIYDFKGTYPGSRFHVLSNPPSLAHMDPQDGQCFAGETQRFAITAYDPDGAQDISQIAIEIDAACGYPYANAVHLWLNPAARRLYLAKDNGYGVREAILPSDGGWGSGQISNSQVTVQLEECRFRADGNALSLDVALRFAPAFAGQYGLCLSITDRSSAVYDERVGDWLIQPPPTRTNTPTIRPTASATPSFTVTTTASATATRTYTPSVTPSAIRTPTPTDGPLHLPLILVQG